MDLAYPVDDLLFRIRGLDSKSDTVSNAVLKFPAQIENPAFLPTPAPESVPGCLQAAMHRLLQTLNARWLLLCCRRWERGKPLEKAIEVSLLRPRRSVDRVSAQLQEWFQDWSSLGWFAQALKAFKLWATE